MNATKVRTGAPPVSRPKARPESRTAAVKTQEAMLARIETVRMAQRAEGNFDCFAKASGGYCDQGGCLYRSDCLSYARQLS